MRGDSQGDLSFLERRLGTRFERRSVAIPPGGERAFADAEWRDALVILEHGEIELVSRSGGRWRFKQGNLIWLMGLPLRAIRNPGTEAAVLVSIRRAPAWRPIFPGARPKRNVHRCGAGKEPAWVNR